MFYQQNNDNHCFTTLFHGNLGEPVPGKKLTITGLLMAPGWLLELSCSRLSLCDCELAGSCRATDRDNSPRTQHPTLRFYTGCPSYQNPQNLPRIWTGSQYARLHAPRLIDIKRQLYMLLRLFI